MSKYTTYNPGDWGTNEENLYRRWFLQREDARSYFLRYIRPRNDKFMKLYASYSGDRQRLIQSWQSNIFAPMIFGTIETMKPRILDARPDFTVLPRNLKSRERAPKSEKILDFESEN